MTLIAITQRAYTEETYGEKRDCLDQQWSHFFHAAGLTPILIPNNIDAARDITASIALDGIVFTGGGTLGAYGGNTPERDEVETFLLHYAQQKSLPLIGICHGMQVIQHHHGITLGRVTGHVSKAIAIEVNGKQETVNSYHDFGTHDTNEHLNTWAIAPDGVIKAVKHISLPITGIMWHPERMQPFSPRDIKLFQDTFKGDK